MRGGDDETLVVYLRELGGHGQRRGVFVGALKEDGEGGGGCGDGAAEAEVVLGQESSPDLSPLGSVVELDEVDGRRFAVEEGWPGQGWFGWFCESCSCREMAVCQDRLIQAHYPPLKWISLWL